MMGPKKTQWELYWKKVDKNGPIHPYYPELGQCWLWIASKREHGHGYFSFDGGVSCASRFAWLADGQELIDGLEICHTCDRGWCQNPAHLFQDTHTENMRWMKEMGRSRDSDEASEQTRGSKNPTAILTEDDVRKMRVMRSTTPRPTVLEISKHFPAVKPSTIKRLLLNRSWKHVV